MTRIFIMLLLAVATIKAVRAQGVEEEMFRPSFHYTPQNNRIGKLSGFVKLDDMYYLYFQKNNRNIEDAYYSLCQITSKDLLTWSEEQEVVRPEGQGEKLKETIYTGSAIIDNENLSKVSLGNTTILLYYVKLGEGVCLSYSNDKGSTWQEFSGNPIISERENEKIEHPYVFFNEQDAKWQMSLSTINEESESRGIEILNTDNLTDFTTLYKSDIACDNASILSYRNKNNNTGLVLVNENGSYQSIDLGSDGINALSSLKWSDNGRVASSAVFCKDGSVYKSISLMDDNFKGMPFRGQLSIPVDVSILDKGDDVVMSQCPVSELSSLLENTKEIKEKLVMPGGKNVLSGVKGVKLRIKGSVEMRSCNYFTIYTRVHRGVSSAQIIYEAENQNLISAGNSADCPLPQNKIIDFDIVIDKTSMEVFANKGEAVIKSLVFTEEDKAIDFVATAKGGEAYIHSLEITELLED